MSLAPTAADIAYACIFTKSVEDATNHLTRLIMNQSSGFDEAVSAWRDTLADLLQTPENLHKLNRFGASFSIVEWRTILTQVSQSLGTGPECEG